MGDLLTEICQAVAESDAPARVQVQRNEKLSDDALMALSHQWRFLTFEQLPEGDLIIMAPVGGESGYSNNNISAQLWNWARQDGTGRAFDSSTGYILPSGAEYSPDASWLLYSRLQALSREEKRRRLRLCPDFVLELRSPTDRMPQLQSKMADYIADGARLGFLIDPQTRRVHIYRPDQPVQILDSPMSVSGDPELPGLVLDLSEVWSPDI